MKEVLYERFFYESHMGNIVIDNEVIAQYAGSVAVELLWYRRYGRSQHEGWSGKAA